MLALEWAVWSKHNYELRTSILQSLSFIGCPTFSKARQISPFLKKVVAELQKRFHLNNLAFRPNFPLKYYWFVLNLQESHSQSDLGLYI